MGYWYSINIISPPINTSNVTALQYLSGGHSVLANLNSSVYYELLRYW